MTARTIALLTTLALAAQGHAQQPAPDWQTKAGNKLSFEVASVRPTEPGKFTPPSFALDPNDGYNNQPGNLFKAGFSLETYIEFAYKLMLSKEQRDAMLTGQPKWITASNFVIEARAPMDKPTKDQMRLMLQSLLADRFHLALHFEKREASVLALTLIKSSKFGPGLRPHAEGPPCDKVVPTTAPGAPQDSAIFPPICYAIMSDMDGRATRMGSRDTTIPVIGNMLSMIGRFDRTIVDQTGLTGNYDFRIEWTPQPPGAATPSDAAGTTLEEAIKEQLGLQLKSTRANIDIPVIDHVELPSEN